MNLETMRAIVAKADNPDVEIQYSRCGIIWNDDNDKDTIEELIALSNSDDFLFRIKPQTITLNAVELPKPFDIVGNKLRVHCCNHYNEGERFYIENFDSYEFLTSEDCRAWVDALNELMGEGK